MKSKQTTMKSNGSSSSKNNLFLASIPTSTSFCLESSSALSDRKSYKSSPLISSTSFSPSSSMDMSACMNQSFSISRSNSPYVEEEEEIKLPALLQTRKKVKTIRRSSTMDSMMTPSGITTKPTTTTTVSGSEGATITKNKEFRKSSSDIRGRMSTMITASCDIPNVTSSSSSPATNTNTNTTTIQPTKRVSPKTPTFAAATASAVPKKRPVVNVHRNIVSSKPKDSSSAVKTTTTSNKLTSGLSTIKENEAECNVVAAIRRQLNTSHGTQQKCTLLQSILPSLLEQYPIPNEEYIVVDTSLMDQQSISCSDKFDCCNNTEPTEYSSTNTFEFYDEDSTPAQQGNNSVNSCPDDMLSESSSNSEHSNVDDKTFQQFITTTCERQRRRSLRTKQQQSVALLFSCTKEIQNDYNSIVHSYHHNNKKTTAASSKHRDLVDIHLHAASHIVQQFLCIIDLVKEFEVYLDRSNNTDQYSYSRSPMQVIYSDMEKFILIQFSLITSGSMMMFSSSSSSSDMSTMKQHQQQQRPLSALQSSKLICWYENYLQHINQIYPDTELIKPSNVWRTNIKNLLEIYVEHGVRQEVNIILEVLEASKDKSNDHDVRHNHLGHVISSRPEEIIYLFDLQIQIAIGSLPDKYVPNVVEVLNDVISNMVRIQSTKTDEEIVSSTISTIRYCSMINDAVRMSHLIQQRNLTFSTNYGTIHDDCLSHVHDINECANNNDSYIDQIIDQMTEVQQEVIELPYRITECLCRHIIYRLEFPESIITSIGQISWECDTMNSVASRTVITLLDFFKVIETYLYNDEVITSFTMSTTTTSNHDATTTTTSVSFFPRVLRECFHLVIQTYVESFFRNTMIFGIRDNMAAAKNLVQDYTSFAKFFNSRLFAKHTNTAGVLSNIEINDSLFILQSMSRIIDNTVSPCELNDDIQIILERVSVPFMEKNTTCVLHLAGLRKGHTSISSLKWIRSIACAQYAIMEHKRKDPSYYLDKFCVRVPDLSNAPFMYQIRVSSDDVTNLFTDEKRTGYAQGVHNILETGYQNLLAMYLARKQQKIEEEQQQLQAQQAQQGSIMEHAIQISDKIGSLMNREKISGMLSGNRIAQVFQQQAKKNETTTTTQLKEESTQLEI